MEGEELPERVRKLLLKRSIHSMARGVGGE
jgi:hypothetical protein